MRVLHFDLDNKDDMKKLFLIQMASESQLNKKIPMFLNLKKALEDMCDNHYLTSFNRKNFMFHEDIVFFIINHQTVMYMLEKDFNKLVIEL